MRYVRVYTDGSNLSRKSNGEMGAGCGVAIFAYGCGEPDKCKRLHIGKYLPHATNNIAELEAIKLGVRHSLEYFPNAKIHVFTDSQYCKGVLNLVLLQGDEPWWEFHARENLQLISGIREMVLNMNGRFKIEWVRGHNNNPGNEVAHTLAKKARLGKKDFLLEL